MKDRISAVVIKHSTENATSNNEVVFNDGQAQFLRKITFADPANAEWNFSSAYLSLLSHGLPSAASEDSPAPPFRDSGLKHEASSETSLFQRFKQKSLALAERLNVAQTWLATASRQHRLSFLKDDVPLIQSIHAHFITQAHLSVKYQPYDPGGSSGEASMLNRFYPNVQHPSSAHQITLSVGHDGYAAFAKKHCQAYGVDAWTQRQFILGHELAHLICREMGNAFKLPKENLSRLPLPSENERIMWQDNLCYDAVMQRNSEQTLLQRRFEEAFADVFALELCRRFLPRSTLSALTAAIHKTRKEDSDHAEAVLIKKMINKPNLTFPDSPETALKLATQRPFSVPGIYDTSSAIDAWVRYQDAGLISMHASPHEIAQTFASIGFWEDWQRMKRLQSGRPNLLSILISEHVTEGQWGWPPEGSTERIIYDEEQRQTWLKNRIQKVTNSIHDHRHLARRSQDPRVSTLPDHFNLGETDEDRGLPTIDYCELKQLGEQLVNDREISKAFLLQELTAIPSMNAVRSLKWAPPADTPGSNPATTAVTRTQSEKPRIKR